VGKQAFDLNRLAQAEYSVLPSFVISAQSLRIFLEQIDWQSPSFTGFPDSALHLDVNNPYQLQAIAQKIRQAIQATSLSPEWLSQVEQATQKLQTNLLILRPSFWIPQQPDISCKMHGLIDSEFCWSEAEFLAQGIKQVWAALFQAKSLLFWQRAGIPLDQIGLSVLVQPAPAAITSGFLQVDADSLTIQATYGLGIALVLGEVIPDVYQVDLQTGEVQKQNLGTKTYAYGLAQTDKQSSSTDCIYGYVLSEEQRQRFALENDQLPKLVHLAQQISQERLDSSFVLEWTLAESLSPESTSEPCFYFLQIHSCPSSVVEQPTAEPAAEAKPVIAPTPSEAGTQAKAPLALISKGLAAASGQAIAPALVLSDPREYLAEPPSDVILVVPSFHPDWLPLLKQAAGIICDTGGMTCHGAIIARELGLPAVVGTINATTLIQAGQVLLVDGDQGEIYQVAPQQTLPLPISAKPASKPEAVKLWPLATQLWVNLSQVTSIQRAQALPVDGVGLLRSESMIVEALEQQHPQLWIQQGRQAEFVDRIAEQLRQFATAFAPRPVLYRSLDLRSHECRALIGGDIFEPLEPNPMLGLRGVSRYVMDSQLFDLELAALAQLYRSGSTNVQLMLPFVRTVEEFHFCVERVQQAGLRVYPQFQLWLMAEVPSILFLLPEYVKAGAQGISIGTNDLTQLLLGVDREQSHLANLFEERHPAVMAAIAQLIQTAKQLRIPCSICGEATGRYPELIDFLVEWGITAISVDPDAVSVTHTAIARAEQRLLLKAVRSQNT
jgi:pyruvate,water dikinase